MIQELYNQVIKYIKGYKQHSLDRINDIQEKNGYKIDTEMIFDLVNYVDELTESESKKYDEWFDKKYGYGKYERNKELI